VPDFVVDPHGSRQSLPPGWTLAIGAIQAYQLDDATWSVAYEVVLTTPDGMRHVNMQHVLGSALRSAS
jgi:hypothetical protein